QLPAMIVYSTTNNPPNGENSIDTTNISPSRLQPGPNVAAVEIHQQAPDSSDVSFNFELLGQSPPPPPAAQPVYFANFDGQPSLAWGDPRLVLQQADSVVGPWSPTGSQSPFVIVPSGTQKFFRLTFP